MCWQVELKNGLVKITRSTTWTRLNGSIPKSFVRLQRKDNDSNAIGLSKRWIRW